MSETVKLPLRAENNPKFYSRFLWLGLAALGFSGYCAYDWLVGYPQKMVRGQGLISVAEEVLTQEELDELAKGQHGPSDYYGHLVEELKVNTELEEAWKEKAAGEGWPKNPPSLYVTQPKVDMQLTQMILAAVIGLFLLSIPLRTRGRWFELNEQGISSRWGESFSLDQITEINKKKWRDKGIAHLAYKDAKGRKRSFVVDDYKYHRKTTDRILWYIENQVGFDKIVGGKPGPDPDAAPQVAPAPAEQAQS